MKVILTILFTVLMSINVSSQIKVYLKNGDISEGRIGLIQLRKFKLKQTKKGKSQSFKAKEIDSIVSYSKQGLQVYHSVLNIFGKPRIFKLYKRGKINIYIIESTTVTGFGNFSSTYYSIKKPNEERCVDLYKGGPYWTNFAKIASNYFEDCPDLANKIKNREKGFTKDDLLNVVEYYNKKCK